jgi:hypothetical protein
MIQPIAWHVLAGFRCVDAVTSSSVLRPLLVTARQLQLRRNRSGVFAVMNAPNLAAYAQSLIPPAPWPTASTTYEIAIEDPSLQYLPRRANIQVPQPLPPTVIPGVTVPPATTISATTTQATVPTTTAAGPTTTPAPSTTNAALTTAAGTTPAPGTTASGPPPLPPLSVPQQVLSIPQQVVLYPSPSAPVGPNWALVRVYVVNNANPPQALFGAVVQVAIAGHSPLTGVTNKNGEALLAAQGLGLTFNADSTGAVTETTTAATVTAWFDKANLNPPPGWVSNPDDTLLNLSSPTWNSTSQPVQLEPKRTSFVNLTIPM